MKNLPQLDIYLKQLIANEIVPGISYGIVFDDDYVGSIGYKSLVPSKEEISVDSLYDIASLTKVVVTVPLIAKLVEKNLISYQDSVKKYLEEFKYSNITIFDLLTHTSGLNADLEDKKIVSKEELIRRVFAQEKVCETGSKVVYSDIGYILLGLIIERIYAKPLDVVAKEEIFEPLNMLDTTYNPVDILKCVPTEVTLERGIVRGIVHDEKACSLNGVAGHAGVFSTVHDLLNFVKMILNKGNFNNRRILSEESIKLWFNPLVKDDKNHERSFCWFVGENNVVILGNKKTISFSGFTGPSISIDLEKNIGIVLLANRIHPTRENEKFIKERVNISKEIYKSLNKNY